MSKEMVDLIDENDISQGKVSRKEMREKALWHRGSAAIILNSKGEILVHKRTTTKDLFPGYYDFFFGGCVNYGESYDENVKREVEEEAGIKDFKAKFLFHHKYDSEETRLHCHVYEVISDGPFKFQKEEVKKAFFVTIEKAKEMIKEEKVCPDGIAAFEEYLKVTKK